MSAKLKETKEIKNKLTDISFAKSDIYIIKPINQKKYNILPYGV